MTLPPERSRNPNGPETYHMHVSQRYLDLTRQKLELARLPREPARVAIRESNHAITKADIEPLLDHWLEGFDFRAQEEYINYRLPQYRVHIASPSLDNDRGEAVTLRVHFVHKRSAQTEAVPLLFCHDWGSSFIEVASAIESLCEPVTTPTQARSQAPAFHVVCPSIPGFGYGDAFQTPTSAIKDTAQIFGRLMQQLGYASFVAYGTGWGFKVAMAIATQFSDACKALFSSNPSVPAPALLTHPIAWLKYQIAYFTGARIPLLDFGYIPADLLRTNVQDCDICTSGTSVGEFDLSFALADSPSGLLAFMLQMMRPEIQSTSAGGNSKDKRKDSGLLIHTGRSAWTPTNILTWTMLYWLSGPEMPLRWLQAAQLETAADSTFWRGRTRVPLGISLIRSKENDASARTCPPAWTAAYCNLKWLQRHRADRPVRWPAWEDPDTFVLDLRAFVLDMQRDGVQFQ